MKPKGKPRDPREEKRQTIYGVRPVLEALRAGRRAVEGVWLLAGRSDRAAAEIGEAAGRAGVPVHREGRGRLTELAGSPDHQGVAARVGPLPFAELEDLAGRKMPHGEADEASGDTLLVLDEILDPRNFGALCRSALSLGCRGVIFAKDRSADPTAAAAKAAAGALERLPLCRVTNLPGALGRLKALGYWIVGLAEDAESSPDEVWCDGPVALVVGSEGRGLRRLVRERCDQLMRIATAPEWPTLNASVAGAIALYEVNVRRR
ncbi:MAG: 23S rRNA (guanosine(2251)-2'-O)-methyltransferase RlmB [Nitrospinota bacterium]